jgi:hypothetical protein
MSQVRTGAGSEPVAAEAKSPRRPSLMANPEHLKLLIEGVDVWNEWRAKEPSVLTDLSTARPSTPAYWSRPSTSRAEPVALVRTRQFAANSCYSLWVLRAAFGSLARTRSCACRQRLGVAGRVSGRGGNERVMPANGGYWQVFGLKKHARVPCHP